MIMAKTVGSTVRAWCAFGAGLGFMHFIPNAQTVVMCLESLSPENHVKISTRRSLEQYIWSAASPFCRDLGFPGWRPCRSYHA